jgi:hypothetical protein
LDYATLGSSVQRLEKRRMKSRGDSPGFWVQERRSQEFPGRTCPRNFPRTCGPGRPSCGSG